MIRIIFMASDSFAISQLSVLLYMKNVEIVAVYTKSPKAQKRGKKILPNEVDVFATKNNLRVYHCDSLLGYKFNSEIYKDIDLIIVSAYGVILPQYVLEYPKYGCINVHPSLLPRWRGASPIQNVILNGDQYTAVSIIKLIAELDAGDIIITKKIPLSMKEDYNTLKTQLADIAGDLLNIVLNNIEDLEACLLNATKQIGEITFCSKLYKKDIDWNDSVVVIDRKIRVFCGMNCKINIHTTGESSVYTCDMNIKIHLIRYVQEQHDQQIGVAMLKDNEIRIYAIDGYIIPEKIQPPSGKIMRMQDFIMGYNRFFK